MKTGVIASIASIFTLAAVTANADNRLWNPADEANNNLADGANWNPTFDLTGETPDDISADVMAINSTTNATLATDFSTATLYVGKGSILNNGNFEQAVAYDNGAKLDVSAGTLTATDTLWVGGGYADRYDSILNLSGTAKVVANTLRTGDCASNQNTGNLLPDGTKACYINVGAGTEVTVAEHTYLSQYSGGTTFVTIDGGIWENGREMRVGSGGDAVFTLNSGTVRFSTNTSFDRETFVGRGGGTKNCKLVINGGEFNSGTIHVGRDGNTGEVDFTSGVSVISNGAWYDTLNLGWGWNSHGTMKVSGDADVTVWGKMVVGRSNKGGSSLFEMSGGSLNITNHDIYVAQDSESVGSMKMTGGNAIMNYFVVGNRGTADVELSGGTLKARHDVRIGDQAVYEEYDAETGAVTKHENAGVGTLAIKTGGTLEVGGAFYVGNNGTGTFVLDGGALTMTGNPVIGNNAGSTGTIQVVSGTLQSGGNDFYVGMRGTGVLTIDGGTVACRYWMDANRDGNSEAEGSAINLNCGGTLNVGCVHCSGKKPVAFNWNGGTFKPNAEYEYIFQNSTMITGNVMRHGAVLDTDGKNRSVDISLVGDGNFVLRGGASCWIKNAADLRRGVRVESGTLVFEQGFVTATTETTPIKEIYVAEGQSLDLKGNVAKPTIYVQSYTRNGVVQEPGEYDDYGATIIVIASGNTVASAIWTNYDGDGALDNPANWDCYNADGILLYDALPSSTARITVPYNGKSLAEYHRVAAAFPNATCVLAFAGAQTLSAAPALAETALGWYDAADAESVMVVDGSVTAVANKGTMGATLDLALKDASKAKPTLTADVLNGHSVLSFDGAAGLISNGALGDALVGNHDRTLLVVGRSTETKDMFLFGVESESDGGSDYGAFRIENWANGGSPRHIIRFYDANAEKKSKYIETLPYNAAGELEIWSASSSGATVSYSRYTATGGVVDQSNNTGGHDPYANDNMATRETAQVVMGMRRAATDLQYGIVAEALLFNKALSTAELVEMRSYLQSKWIGSASGASQEFGDIELVDGAVLDLDGYPVSLNSVSGSGTISNGTVTAIGTLNIVVNSDGTANKVVIPNGLNVAGMKVNITGIGNLKQGQPVVVLEAATGVLTGAIAAADVTTDDPSFRYRLKVNADGKLELAKSLGFIMILR